jgi:hypothetical protein
MFNSAHIKKEVFISDVIWQTIILNSISGFSRGNLGYNGTEKLILHKTSNMFNIFC